MMAFRIWLESSCGFKLWQWKAVCWLTCVVGFGASLFCAWQLFRTLMNFIEPSPIWVVGWILIFFFGFWLGDDSYTEARHGF